MLLKILAGLIVLIYTKSFLETKQLNITEYTIINKKIPRDLDGTSFVVLADLHNKTIGKDNKKLIQSIKELNPSYILIPGDHIIKKKPCLPSNAYRLLENLARDYTIYYSFGNHEQYKEDLEGYEFDATWVEYKDRLRKLGVELLDNRHIRLSKQMETIEITGLSLPTSHSKKKGGSKLSEGYMNALIGAKNDHAYQILLAHNPDYFEEYAAWGADLTIAGHIHGGLIRLPKKGGLISPQYKFFPEYDSGIYKKDEKEMIVSRGLGYHSIMLRLFNPPELIYFKLKNDK